MVKHHAYIIHRSKWCFHSHYDSAFVHALLIIPQASFTMAWHFASFVADKSSSKQLSSSSSISKYPFILCVLVCADLFHNKMLDWIAIDRLLCRGTLYSISSSSFSSLLAMESPFILCVLASSGVFHNVMLDLNEDQKDFCCFAKAHYYHFLTYPHHSLPWK